MDGWMSVGRQADWRVETRFAAGEVGAVGACGAGKTIGVGGGTSFGSILGRTLARER